jgi:hypothetical protein
MNSAMDNGPRARICAKKHENLAQAGTTTHYQSHNQLFAFQSAMEAPLYGAEKGEAKNRRGCLVLALREDKVRLSPVL